MNNTGNRKALGRGLDALLPGRAAVSAPAGASIVEIVSVDLIEPDPNQPRRQFKNGSLNELAESVRRQGILQPLLLRKIAGRYRIIAGERRFHAASLAGLAEVPAIVRQNVGDREALELAIVENLQREDLTPLEQARGFERLQREFSQTQEAIAERTGKDRATIANFLRLLKLDGEVQQWLEAAELSMGHAKALLPLAPELQRSVGRQAIHHAWSVRETERQVQQMVEPRPAVVPVPRDPNVREAEDRLTRALGAKVQISGRGKRKGRIEIAYAGLDDFQRLFDRLLR